jgi:hypothetical protein
LPIVFGFREMQTGLRDRLQLARPTDPFRFVDHRPKEIILLLNCMSENGETGSFKWINFST